MTNSLHDTAEWVTREFDMYRFSPDIQWARNVMVKYGFPDSTEWLKWEIDFLRWSIKDSLEMYMQIPVGWTFSDADFDNVMNYLTKWLPIHGEKDFIHGRWEHISVPLTPIDLMIRLVKIKSKFLARFGVMWSAHSDTSEFSLVWRIEKYARMTYFYDFLEIYWNQNS